MELGIGKVSNVKRQTWKAVLYLFRHSGMFLAGIQKMHVVFHCLLFI